MFRPIKNFLSYIQNNTNSKSIFGGATGPKESKRETSTEVFESDTTKLADGAKMSVRKLSSAVSRSDPASVVSFADIDVDDIETQIQSSIMLRKPLNTYNSTQLHVYSGNHAGSSGKLEDLQLETVSVADSDEELGRKLLVPAEGLGTEDAEILVSDEEESNFLHLGTHEFDAFPNNELIVLDENELNNSMNSDVLCEDPLAIDEFIVPESSFAQDTFDSSKSQNETSTDELWVNIDDIKTCDKTLNLQKSACEQSTPPITPTITEKHEDHIATNVMKSNVLNKSTHAQEEDEHPEELRSEGSDSGLGSETSALQITISSANGTPTQTSTDNKVVAPSSIASINLASTETILPVPTAVGAPSTKKPTRSNLKRRLVETEDDSTLDSTPATDHSPSVHHDVTVQKKSKRSINFNQVQVYYFQRQQGFGCVPSAGGCTLGMEANHVSFKTLTLAEHAAELRRAHRQQLQEVSPRGAGGSSSDDSEESEEDYLSEGSDSDADAESSGFLQPVSPKQRRALLKAAGVRKIDANEKVECRNIRNSREVCGCTCRDFCDPETCACSQAGIKCQVDRAMFPCGCSREACGNAVGRVEFNPSRVRTHFIHTIMRLEMESRQQQKPNLVTSLGYDDSAAATSSPSSALNQMSANYYSMQPPQSNYSSGYASPAYPPLEQTSPPAYYQQQAQHLYDVGALQNSTSLSQAPQQAYQVDGCLDASLLLGGVNTTPSYGELMTSYGNEIHAPLSYADVSTGITTNATVPTLSYSSYVAPSPNYLPIIAATTSTNSTISSYSSCAVPSVPPYGPAMTTASSSTQYHSSNSVSGCEIETNIVTSPSPASIGNCSTLENASNFISLNSPISSSSRLSVINDLLQHNRNTTAALVAVSHTASGAAGSTLCNSNSDSSINSSSISLPPILDFDGMAPSLSSMPLTTILGEPETVSNKSDIAGIGVLAKALQTEIPSAVVAARPVDVMATPANH